MANSPHRKRKRLDILLVERGLAPSREHAKRLILAGKVESQVLKIRLKPGIEVYDDIDLNVVLPDQFVSRGGLKLQAALDYFTLSVDDKICADIGASTGGFTDCFLQNGARHVFAVDVGSGQLAEKLRKDLRVTFLGNINARNLTNGDFPQPVSLVAVDVSFISLTRIFVPLYNAVAKECEAVFLIKPQFEAGKEEVSRGRGIIRDAEVHREILLRIMQAMGKVGWHVRGVMSSPITGGSGNREFLCHASRRDKAQDAEAVANITVDHLFQEVIYTNMPDVRPE